MERVAENQKNLRQQRVRELIDEYTENNQMTIFRVGSTQKRENTINGSFKDNRNVGIILDQ